MSDMPENPYASPQAETSEVRNLSQGRLTEEMLAQLKGASPWIRFIGIVGFVLCGVYVLMAIGMAIAFAVSDFGSIVPGMPAGMLAGALVPGMGIGLVMFFLPSLFAFRFGQRLRAYFRSGDDADLETAFRNNKNLWTFIGVVTIIYLAFFALILVMLVIAAAFAAASVF